jgi:hypothetical protein
MATLIAALYTAKHGNSNPHPQDSKAAGQQCKEHSADALWNEACEYQST